MFENAGRESEAHPAFRGIDPGGLANRPTGGMRCRFPALRLVLLLWAVLGWGCSGDPGTGPVEVKWDRDACTRCNMVLSDRHHAAQVRHTPDTGGRSRVYKFDDIGCAVVWLDRQPWRDAPDVEIWVTDHRNGDWLDARSAYYVTGQLTPMQYGLGARPGAAPGALTFAEAKEHIHRIEREQNVHGGPAGHAARHDHGTITGEDL